jgi:hypothetical protein
MVPPWWQDVAGVDREEFGRRTGCIVLARYSRVTILSAGVRPGCAITGRLFVTTGSRSIRDGSREYCGIDRLEVRDAETENLLGELYIDWLWLRQTGHSGFRRANEPPAGLEHLNALVPAPPAMPAPPDKSACSRFRWTSRETDYNQHIAFQSYFDRAENAVADLGLATSDLGVWEAWYRRRCLAGEVMRLDVGIARDDGIPMVLSVDGETTPRAVLRNVAPGGQP